MNKQMPINWNSRVVYKQEFWDLVYSRSKKLREEGRIMTFEEQQYMIQGLSDMLQSEKKEKKELQDLVSALTSPRLSEYDGLYKQIEEQQKVIDDQLETIENQKKALKKIVRKMCTPREPIKTFDRALGDVFECPECGVIIEPNVNFCEDCGARISWEAKNV